MTPAIDSRTDTGADKHTDSRWWHRFRRAQPYMSLGTILLSGVGVIVAVSVLGLIAELTGHPLLIASFGASCALICVLPSAPVSRPINMLGGHLVATAAGLAMLEIAPASWWTMGLATGVGVMLMTGLRVLHPPAAAMPILVILTDPGWMFLLTPVMAGAAVITVIAEVYRLVLGKRVWRA